MKKQLPYVLALVLFFALCPPSHGKEKAKQKEMTYAPKYVTFASANNNGILRMDCEGEDNFVRLTCDFTQILILKNTEAELTEKRKEFREQATQIQKEDFNKLKKTMTENLKITKERQALLDSLTPEKKRYFSKMMGMIQGMQKSRTKAELTKAIEDFNEFENQCCSFSVNSYKQSFKRTSPNKWISNPGPEGRCDVVRVSTLEREKEYSSLWKYTTTAVSVDYDKNSDDMFSKMCAAIELNKPVVYSWEIPKESIIDCQCIKFGW
jgi:hypothetical protein